MKRMTNSKAVALSQQLAEIMAVSGTRVEFGGAVEIDGNLQVNGTMGLYVHNIYLSATATSGEIVNASIQIINKSSTAFTFATLRNYVLVTDEDYKKVASGAFYDSSLLYSVYGINAYNPTSSSTIILYGQATDETIFCQISSSCTIVDNVISL